MLAGGAGVAALFAVPDLSSPGIAYASSSTNGTAQSHLFLYGVPGPTTTRGPSVQSARAPSDTSHAGVPTPHSVATGLTSTPVRSPDGATLALATVDGSTVRLSLIDAKSAGTLAHGTLELPHLPHGSTILATPVPAPNSATVPLVLAISTPTNQRRLDKKSPSGGKTETVTAAKWTTYHAIAYFDRRSGAFSAVHDVDDGPALPLSSAAANAHDLFLWTVKDPAASHSTKRNPAPAPVPRLSVFRLGSAKPRLTTSATGAWPSGEPVATLSTGDVARLVDGRDLEIYSAHTGKASRTRLSALDGSSAKPGTVAMAAQHARKIFITNSAIGRAVIVDAGSGAAESTIKYPAPAGRVQNPATLSSDGRTVYTLGSVKSGGISAYNASTGALTASYSHGNHYVGVHALPSGAVLAVAAADPRLHFFTKTLEPIGTANTPLQVSAVF